MSVERYAALINGEPFDDNDVLVDVDPATGGPIAEVVVCGPERVDQAVEAARSAFENVWRKMSPAERGGILRRIAQLVQTSSDELAELESLDTGKPLRQARADVQVAARYFEFYAGAAEVLHGDSMPRQPQILAFTTREPLGVTGHIIPWNYPIQIASRTVAPALAAGNCCVVKPGEDAPLSVLRLGAIAIEAGLPPGALNILPGPGELTGAALARHQGIDHLSFTGSVATGIDVATAAARNVAPVILELGGKSPNIVFADADLEAALPVISNSVLQNAGQTCAAGSRLLVDESIEDEVLEALSDRFSTVRIGPGLQDPDLGPLISEVQKDRLMTLVGRANDEAQLVTGGSEPSDESLAGGYFFLPTIFRDPTGKTTVSREEFFGPVVAVTPFSSPEEAIALANGTDYGLVAAVWTKDVGRAHSLVREIRAGQVFVNTYGAGGGVELPFGGFRHSGYGREKGFEALTSYTQTKTVVIRVPDES